MTDWRYVILTMAPKAHLDVVAMIADHADSVFRKYDITTVRRQACVLAHMYVETQGFTRLEENLNYTAQRLRQVWPTHFTPAEAQACAHKPKLIAAKAYGGRMGNRPGTDDGWTFRGQGLWHCTGRSNVTALAKYFGITPEKCAEWLLSPEHALECVAALFHLLKVAPSADSGDVTAQTKKVNGGKNGLAERKAAYASAMRLLSVETASKQIAQIENPKLPDPPVLTVADLREDGSRIIKNADTTQKALVGVLGSIASATVVLQQTNDALQQAKTAVETINTTASYYSWVQQNWQILFIGIFSAFAAMFAYRIWTAASKAKRARVDDANTGANLART